MIKELLYTRLAEAVQNQTPDQREQTKMSGGLLCYRIPRSMDSERGPCCQVQTPCRVHRSYFLPDSYGRAGRLA